MKKINLAKSRKESREYLKARAKFLRYANQSHELDGNDNIVGRIGEFIAFQFLIARDPEVVQNKTNKGYDIVCSDGSRISVKTITHESATKRTTRVKEPWDELVVIELGENAKILRIGHLTKIQFKKAVKEKGYSLEPYCKDTMLNNNGMIGHYGNVIYENDLPQNVTLQ